MIVGYTIIVSPQQKTKGSYTKFGKERSRHLKKASGSYYTPAAVMLLMLTVSVRHKLFVRSLNTASHLGFQGGTRAFSSNPAFQPREDSGSRYSRDRFADASLGIGSKSITSSNTQLSAFQNRRAAPRREDFYSINDVFGDEGVSQQRPYPPAMDSQDEEDGFGAYDYDTELDMYDQADMKQQERVVVSNGTDASTDDSFDPSAVLLDDLDIPSPSPKNAQQPRSNNRATWAPVSTSLDLASSSPAKDDIPVREASVSSVHTESQANTIADPVKTPSVSPAMKVTAVLPKFDSSSADSMVPPTHFHAGQTPSFALPDPARDAFLSKASFGSGATTSLDVLEAEMLTLTELIYQQTNGKEFNINAPKQVAAALFGSAGGSTNKDVLEGMAAGGNRLAALILDYRALKNQIGKLTRRQESVAKGTAVRSASTVARPQLQAVSLKADVAPEETILLDEMADPLLLLDASAYIFRAYYSMPPIHRPDGMPTGAVMGFCKMLNSMLLGRMLEGEQPRLVLCFDAKGKTFRHDLFDDYKGNRASAPMDLVPQFELVRQAAKAYGIFQIEAKYFEADDVIATLATMAVAEGVDANILSGDKDLMQLVTDLGASPSIQMIDPMKKDRTTYLQVVEKWEVPPNKLGDVLALVCE